MVADHAERPLAVPTPVILGRRRTSASDGSRLRSNRSAIRISTPPTIAATDQVASAFWVHARIVERRSKGVYRLGLRL